ncbi:DNA sulfur modification protein DndD [Dorea sp. D27]|uniref:DNA sulfur modification protein DndD n=1 Tax=Dorea sp. D27 TaxID=658665 RepID=UPI0006735933|nr:DNA sulfur modification protein DndD [Dorea sp. D27]KMZ53076.1 DNA sulfur modification protein DndD [Dorea sp. D27]
MKLKKLMLENIGAFVNKNELDFECDKPIILIGGMNGRGKTTVLEAVLLALYGKRSGNLIGSHQKFDGYLRKISNTKGNRDKCVVELSFYVKLDKVDMEYRVKRCWNIQTKHLKVETKAWKNGIEDKALSESWDMLIEEILPHAVAPFFFFDGEKISELASAENEEQISDSIKSLLGIDLIEKLIHDLEIVESKKLKALNESDYTIELKVQENAIKENKRQLELNSEQLKKIRKDNKYLRKELEELEEKYTMAGGYFSVHKQEIEKEYEIVKENYKNIETELLEIAAGDLPLKMVEDFLDEIYNKTEQEQQQREIEILLKRIPEFYLGYCSTKSNTADIKDFLHYINLKANKTPLIYGLDEEGRYQLKNTKKTICNDSKRARMLIEEKKKLNKRIEELENYLLIKTDDVEVETLYSRIKEKTAEIAIQDDKIKTLENVLKELTARAESLEKGRVRILEKVIEGLEAADDAKRVIEYVLQQINILSKYKLELQSLKVEILATKMTECFKRLIAKEGLINYISIDSETLEFLYYNNQNEKVDKMILSAGEKQLLVIAMLWALGICARAKFPLIIDTPLARLDSQHRASLINNYFPYASEQVIILSTDQEITSSEYMMLKEYIGKEYILQYHEDTMSSTVEEGYFRRDIK